MHEHKLPETSALVDLVMEDATEEERREATRNWFGFLSTLLKIVEDQEKSEAAQSDDSNPAQS